MSKEKNKDTKSTKYFVRGMHCSTCEILIKQDIMNLKGVKNADVSLGKQTVLIQTEDSTQVPTKDSLNKLFSELGYTFHDSQIQEQSLNTNDVYTIGVSAVILIFLFYIFERSGIPLSLSLSSQSSLLSFFLFGLAAGVSSCAALVGGLLLSLSKKWNELYGNNGKQSKMPFIYFNLSRILAFALLGGFLGYVGSFFKTSISTTAFLTILISLVMIVLGLQMTGIKWFKGFSFNLLGNNKYLDKNSDLQGKYIPIIVGALTFFVPCGFTLIAQTNALSSGSFYLGALELGAFALGTLPILALISFTSVKFYSNPSFSKKFSLFSGIIIIFFAIYTLNSQLNVLGITSLSDLNLGSKPAETTTGVTTKQTDTIDYQELKIVAEGFEYNPRQISIRSGVKTKWIIDNKGAVGCANAVFARGLYPNVIQLKPGINTVEFTAPKPGTYKITCSMGMVAPVTVTIL